MSARGAFGLLIAASVGLSTLRTGEPAGAVQSGDAQLLQALLTVDAAAAERGVWPEYRVLGVPVLLNRPGRVSYFIGRVPPSPQFHRCAGQPENVWCGPPAAFEEPFGWGRLAGAHVFWIRLGSRDFLDEVASVVHERAHMDERERRLPCEPGGRAPPIDDPEHLALAMAEQHALSGALEARDAKGARAGLAAFSTLRDRRQRLHDVRRYEDCEEATEGRAEYIQSRALEAARLRPDRPEPRAARLRERIAPDQLHKRRSYDIGAAIGTVLDRLGVATWKRTLDRGVPLSAQAAQAAVGAKNVVLPPLAPLRALARELVERRRAEVEGAVAAFEAFPRRLRLEVPDRSLLSGAYTVGDSHEVPGGGDLFPTVFGWSIDTGRVRLVAKKTSVRWYREVGILELPIPDGAALELDGKAADPNEAARFDLLRIRHPRLDVALRRGRFDPVGGSWWVTLDGASGRPSDSPIEAGTAGLAPR